MSQPSPAVAHERAKIAALTRSRTADDPELIDARRNFLAAKIEAYIRRSVDAAPPLTTDQREHLATILRGAAHDAAA